MDAKTRASVTLDKLPYHDELSRGELEGAIEQAIIAAEAESAERERERIALYFDLRASLALTEDGKHQWTAAATDVRDKADVDAWPTIRARSKAEEGKKGE